MFVNDGQCNPEIKEKTDVDIKEAMVQKGFVFLL